MTSNETDWSGQSRLEQAYPSPVTEEGRALTEQERAIIAPLLRRIPNQARSWRRVDDSIIAAEAILEERGYEDLLANPTALFARARVPIGTFYDYFEAPESVVECIRLLWTHRIAGIVDAVYSQPCSTWEEVADRAVDSTVAFFRRNGARELWLTHQLTPAARQAEIAVNQASGARMRAEVERLGHRFSGDALDELVLVEISDQLTRFAFLVGSREEPEPRAVDRARRATRQYLAALIEDADDLHQTS